MLTATGQNQRISHGFHIRKDQDDSSQDAEHGYQFNNIVCFIDNISFLAETPEGMQTLLNVVQSSQHGVAWGSILKNFLARD